MSSQKTKRLIVKKYPNKNIFVDKKRQFHQKTTTSTFAFVRIAYNDSIKQYVYNIFILFSQEYSKSTTQRINIIAKQNKIMRIQLLATITCALASSVFCVAARIVPQRAQLGVSRVMAFIKCRFHSKDRSKSYPFVEACERCVWSASPIERYTGESYPGKAGNLTLRDLLKAKRMATLDSSVYKKIDSERHVKRIGNWKFQNRVEKLNARADVYFNDKGDQCLVSICGSNDWRDWLINNRKGLRRHILHSGPHGDAYVMGGVKDYYDMIRDDILGECKEKAHVIMTGHSLGAGAAEMGYAYGDADETWTFAGPKIFVSTGIKSLFHSTCPYVLSNATSFYNEWEKDGTFWGKKLLFDIVPSLHVFGGGLHCAKRHFALER